MRARCSKGSLARVRSDPSSATQREMSFPETRRFWADLGAERTEAGDDAEPAEHPYLFSRSEFFARPLPAEAIAALLETFSRERAPGESRELDFMPWGGAYNRVPSDATAFVHRDELFLLKHSVVVDRSASTGAKEAAHRQVDASWASVHAWGSGRSVPELRGSRPRRVGGRLRGPEPRPPGPDQGALRPIGLLLGLLQPSYATARAGHGSGAVRFER